MAKSKKQLELEQQLGEAIQDLQRTRADFENYRKRMELEKSAARESGTAAAALKLLPTIDNIERAISHLPAELTDNSWAQSIVKLTSQLEKSLETLDLKRIAADKGSPFNPEIHEAIQFDDAAEGENEVIDEVLQAGYTLKGTPIRPAMVKVTRN